MTIRIGAVDFFVVAAYMVIFGFLWRSLAARWSERPLGKAMAYIY
jgi:hypothetical protein